MGTEEIHPLKWRALLKEEFWCKPVFRGKAQFEVFNISFKIRFGMHSTKCGC